MWIAYYAALARIDLSIAATGIYTTPLCIAGLSSLVANEPVGRRAWIGIVMGFVGVVIILRPGEDNFSARALPPILAAFLYALAAIVTRTLCPAEDPMILALSLHVGLFAVGVLGTIVMALTEPHSGNRFLLGSWAPMGSRDWLIMAGPGLVMVEVATAVAKACQSGPPSLVGTFDYA
jgi:drug/metabolite transporter (DMT)-like permease